MSDLIWEVRARTLHAQASAFTLGQRPNSACLEAFHLLHHRVSLLVKDLIAKRLNLLSGEVTNTRLSALLQ
jgi:hypothetical protein